MNTKIRIGNDIDIRWSIFDSSGDPYIMVGKDIEVELDVGTKKVKIKDVEIDENVLHFVYYGKDQKYVGNYILKFIENGGQVDMVTFDTKDAFTLVEHSWLAIDEGETPETVQLEFVTVSSNLHSSVGPAAGFGEVTAELVFNGGEPSVDVEADGPDTAKNFHFTFYNLGADIDYATTNDILALFYGGGGNPSYISGHTIVLGDDYVQGNTIVLVTSTVSNNSIIL